MIDAKQQCRTCSGGKQQASGHNVRCAQLLGLCATFLPPDPLAETLVGLYDTLDASAVAPRPELMEALIAALGKLAAASGSAECLKELLTRLYTRRFSQTFSNSGLLITVHQLEVPLGLPAWCVKSASFFLLRTETNSVSCAAVLSAVAVARLRVSVSADSKRGAASPVQCWRRHDNRGASGGPGRLEKFVVCCESAD